jgi:hypothetical protein
MKIQIQNQKVRKAIVFTAKDVLNMAEQGGQELPEGATVFVAFTDDDGKIVRKSLNERVTLEIPFDETANGERVAVKGRDRKPKTVDA